MLYYRYKIAQLEMLKRGKFTASNRFNMNEISYYVSIMVGVCREARRRDCASAMRSLIASMAG